jgi:hypothetical protein
MFPPTECDPVTTTPSIDPETGVVTCIGTGGGGCTAPFACPTPAMANRLTICGQLFDIETNAKFADAMATGAPCTTPTASGPCALQIAAYDALEFGADPMNAMPRPVGSVYLDDCGRYRVVDIDTNGTGPFIGLGFDDAGGPIGNPAGVTVTVGVAAPKVNPVVSDFEAWIVKGSTTALWAMNGGPPLSGGIYLATYRAHKLGPGVDRHAPQAGVQFAKMGAPLTANDHYFQAALTTHTLTDPAASVTGMNGTVLVTNRSVAESVAFDGIGGLGAGCRWEPHAAASLPGIVFAQVYRKTDLVAQPGSCTD